MCFSALLNVYSSLNQFLMSVCMVKQPCRHPACLNVYRFAASSFFLTPVFICDVFNAPEVMK